MIHYVDSSALVKLVSREMYSEALGAWIRDVRPEIAISELVVTESLRAARRIGPSEVEALRDLIARIQLRTITYDVWSWAGEIDPHSLRTLDAVHLAVALSFGRDLAGVVTYDMRMAEACHQHGITVIAPGAD